MNIRQKHMLWILTLATAVLILMPIGCGCGSDSEPDENIEAVSAPAPTSTEAQTDIRPKATVAPTVPTSPTPEVTPTAPVPLGNPFEGQNMFFGLTILSDRRDYELARDLDASWISMQPIVIWGFLEESPGRYNWTSLDAQVLSLQKIGVDCTMVLMPMYATDEEKTAIKAIIGDKDPLTFFRSKESARMQLYPNTAEERIQWRAFLTALVERYDGDGKNDSPALKYPVRSWHFLEEYPEIWIPDTQVYTDLLKEAYTTIHAADSNARVILMGLASNFAQYFAFADGFIDDPDAGVINGRKLTRAQINLLPQLKKEREAFEYALREGKGYFDAVDLHLYEPKETFPEGKIKWLRSMLDKYDIEVPVWCIEGGGPFKLKEGQISDHGDPYFGYYSDKENAEFVVKMHVIAAANGMERFHWGLSENAETDYWNGPWSNMGLVSVDRGKKPAFYTFKLLRETLRDFTAAKDLSSGQLRLYAFNIGGKQKYVAWLMDATAEETINFSKVLPHKTIRVGRIVTELDAQRMPVVKDPIVVQASAVPLSNAPVFLEAIEN